MRIAGKVVRGYGVASGLRADSHYAEGTIKMQVPFFKERGLDISKFFMGTINVDISPLKFEVKSPKYQFKDVPWTHHIPPETFFFFDISVEFNDQNYVGYIYLPDPETKIEHHQGNSLLELLLPKIDEIKYGDEISIEINEQQLLIH